MRRFIRWALMAASVGALGCGVAVPLATASAAATPACTTTVNWIGLPGEGYAGGQVVQLEFSNTGKATCTLHGHPGVAQMNAARQVGRPAVWTGAPATVTLRPGATAHAVLNIHNAGALCAKPQTSTYLSVIAPGQRLAFPDPLQSRACPGKSVMHVGPVRPGVGAAYPQLASHSLDSLLTHLPVAAPRGRHRAMPDTEATAAIFTRILTDGPATGNWRTLADLRRAAGYKARAALPVQDALFPASS